MISMKITSASPPLQNYQFIEKIKKLPFVQEIILYGSRARGDHSETSDIDLAINCPTASNEDWLALLEIVDTADTLLKIDCVRLDEVDANLKENIHHEGKKIYERKA